MTQPTNKPPAPKRTHLAQNEEWRPIFGWEGLYEVSDIGRVRSVDKIIPHRGGSFTVRGRIRAPQVNAKGYLRVGLSHCGARGSMLVHVAVAEAFICPKPHGMQVAHNDGDPKNNIPSNLRWATAKENSADRLSHGTHQVGTKNHHAKVNEEIVRRMRADRKGGMSMRAVSRKYGLSSSGGRQICTGKHWSHVLDEDPDTQSGPPRKGPHPALPGWIHTRVPR